MKNIIDCFPYFNEKELLELRIKMLDPYVDQFVISEANLTHSGVPKEFVVKNLINELDLPKHKIRVLEVDLTVESAQTPSYIDLCHSTSAKSAKDAIYWTRERLQRDAIAQYIDEYDDETVFIMSDCDEIIDPTSIDFLVSMARKHPHVVIRVPLRLLESYADMEVTDLEDNPVSWDDSMFLCMKHHIRNTEITLLKANRTPNEFSPWNGLYIHQSGSRLENLGWHFTWMGNTNRKVEKSKSFIHHSNLNVVNNVSQETISLLSKQLNQEIITEKKYKLKKIKRDLLPKQIFEKPHIEKFLLGDRSRNTFLKVNVFLYGGETELLELRLKLLYQEIDLFLIIESNKNFDNTERQFDCDITLDILGIPKDKIKILKINIPEDIVKPKDIESYLFNSARKYLIPDYQCLITTVNEIPNPDYFNYYFNILEENPDVVLRYPMVVISGKGDLFLCDLQRNQIQRSNSYLCSGKKFITNQVSDMRITNFPGVYSTFLSDGGIVENAGWKFDLLGDIEKKKEYYKKSLCYGDHSVLGRKLRLEYLEDFRPYAGSAEPLGQIEYRLDSYDKSKLPSLIFNTPRLKNFFFPQDLPIDKEIVPLKFDDTHLPLLKFNKSAENMIFVVDDFYEDPYSVREFAMNQEFEYNPDSYGYVGRRTNKQFFPPGLKERFEEIIGESIVTWEDQGMNGRFQYNVAGEKLVFHCDDQKWAGLIYLTPDAPYQAGTRMLAHKKTRIRYNKHPKIMQCFNQETFLDGTPYETVDQIGNVFNRLVIYKGGLLHAATEYFGWNIENARLWHMFFFD
jgi:hypothetical protein